MNKVDMVDDEELLELVEMEFVSYYHSMSMMVTTPVLLGSALELLTGEQKWVDTVMELMEAVDTWIESPET